MQVLDYLHLSMVRPLKASDRAVSDKAESDELQYLFCPVGLVGVSLPYLDLVLLEVFVGHQAQLLAINGRHHGDVFAFLEEKIILKGLQVFLVAKGHFENLAFGQGCDVAGLG
jgi:hypothetical protein